MVELTLQKIGNSVGVVLPKEVRRRMRLEAGDRVFLVETESGWRITPYDPEFEKQMREAEKVTKKYRDALRDLAK
jgi:putative addiction module antidote